MNPNIPKATKPSRAEFRTSQLISSLPIIPQINRTAEPRTASINEILMEYFNLSIKLIHLSKLLMEPPEFRGYVNHLGAGHAGATPGTV